MTPHTCHQLTLSLLLAITVTWTLTAGEATLSPTPANLSPVSRALFSDPNQDSYQGWAQAPDGQGWGLQSFHRGDGSAPAPRLLIGNRQGKIIGTVSGTFATYDWGWGNRGLRRYGPLFFNNSGAWCVMTAGFGETHQLIVNGKPVAATGQKPTGWGLSRDSATWWYAVPTGSGSPARSTFVINGRVVVEDRYVAYPRLLDRMISPDGKRVAVASGKDHGFFDLQVDDQIFAREFDALLDLAWSSDSQRLAAVIRRADRCQVLIDGKPIGEEFRADEVRELAFDPSGKAVAAFVTVGKESVLLWNGAVAAKVPYDRLDFQLSAQSSNGQFLAVCAQRGLSVGPLTILDTATGMITSAGSPAKVGQVMGGDGRFAILDDGTPIIATVTDAGHALYRGEHRVSVGNDPQPWSHLMPSPDGRFLMATASGHPFPCFVNGFGVGKVGEQFLRAWWSPDSQYLAVVTKDRGDKQVISVNGTAIQRMDECLAAWFDGIILRYLMRRGDAVSLSAVSLDGKALPDDDAVADKPATTRPVAEAKIEPLPATILGRWTINSRKTLCGLLKITEEEFTRQLHAGELDANQMAQAEAALKAKRVEIRADRLRVTAGDQITEQTLAVTAVRDGIFHLKTIDPPGSTLEMTPGTSDRLQTLTVVMKDGTQTNVLHLVRRP